MAKLKAPADIGQKRTDSRFPVVFTVLFTLTLIFMHWRGTFGALDSRWTDRLFRVRGMDKGDSRIVVVEIDDASLKKVGAFPFPRRVYADLIEKSFNLGVKVLTLDVLFVDPSPSPEDDKLLIDITEKEGEKLVHSAMVDPSIVNQHVFVFPFEALHKAAKSIGLVYQPLVDDDGAVRRSPLFVGAEPVDESAWGEDPAAVPSLGLVALARFEGKPVKSYLDIGSSVRLNYRGEEDEVIGTQMVDGERRSIVVPVRGYRHIPIWKILNDELTEAEKEALDGSIALVGSTAIGYFDHYPNPFMEAMPGVLVHATLIDNILNNRYLVHVSVLWTMLLIIAFSMAAYWAQGLGPIRAAASAAILTLGWAAFTYLTFTKNFEMDFTAPFLALGGVFVALTVYKVVLEQAAKKEVRNMFGQYVAPEVVDILVKDPSKLKLGGQKRDMTMYFLDIAHFTTISEKMAPENLIQFLNHYLTALTDDILANNGVVDKYIGDCIMAFWNAPLEEPDHRRKACLAAVDCVKTIERLNKDYVDPTIPEAPAVRIGLNSGQVIVGNTGSARKLAYTVLGDEVNLASRLEGANKFFGSTIMVSENTYEGAKDAVEARVLGSVRVVGKEIPIRVFELLARKGRLSEGWRKALPIYQAAIDKYLKREFEGAKADFEKVLELAPGDKPTKLYVSTCDDYIIIPPPDNWDGVFNLTSK